MVLQDLPAYFVGVRCPVEVIVARRDADPGGGGGGGWAPTSPAPDGSIPDVVLRWERAVHDPGMYDLEVDTSTSSPDECAAAILRGSARAAGGVRDVARVALRRPACLESGPWRWNGCSPATGRGRTIWCSTRDMAAAFATATRDDTASYFDGTAVPPTAIATQTYAPQMAAIFELVPEPVFAAAHGGVHGRHDLLLHRAIRPGEELHTLVETHSARRSKDNLRVTLLHRTYDALEQLVAEQWWTTVLLGTTADETGPDLPAHGGNGCGPEQAMAEEVVRTDMDMVRRYAEISGDFSDHHFDVEAARRSGFAGPFLHGLCTMALCARAVVGTHVSRRPVPAAALRRAVRLAGLPPSGPDRADLRSRPGPRRLRGDERGQRRHPKRLRRTQEPGVGRGPGPATEAGNCTCSAWANNAALSALRMYPPAIALFRLFVYWAM